MSAYACRVCGAGKSQKAYAAKEMMFGLGAEFIYDECGACGSLQIRDIPSDEQIKQFYPDTYYSYGMHPVVDDDSGKHEKPLGLRTQFKRMRAAALFARERAQFDDNRIGAFLSLIRPNKPNSLFSMVASAGVGLNDAILDVGCGNGAILDYFSQVGFLNLTGLDPFIKASATTSHGVPLYKSNIQDFSGAYDLIMFNHSLEHVASPFADLSSARKLLSPKGVCLIRIPTISSDAWDAYGTNWVQLDAPRHFTLISRRGMEQLAQRCGFRIADTIDDEEGWALMSSELYARAIPLVEHDYKKYFRDNEIVAYERRAAAHNAAKRGDQAGFILKKTEPAPD